MSTAPEGNKKEKTMTTTGFIYEVYLNGPNGESGWDIATGFFAGVDTRERAEDLLREKYREKFDCTISCYKGIK